MPNPALLSAAALCALWAASASLAAERSLGTFRDWSTIAFGGDKSITCMAFSQPIKSKGDYARRGDVFIFVTHRPAEDERNRVSVEAGYSYSADKPADVLIDGTAFELRTDGSTAWLADASRELELVKAMKAGREMVITGTSARGTPTRDEYSLFGFTAAVRAIDSACK